jgi:hypothetical protein
MKIKWLNIRVISEKIYEREQKALEAEKLNITAKAYGDAERATIEHCARHVDAIEEASPSETAKRILKTVANSIRKLGNVKNG